MKKFEERYKNYFENVHVPVSKKNKIMENVLNKKRQKYTFKFAYVLPIAICVFLLGGVIGVTANTIVKHHKTIRNSEYLKSIEVFQDKIDADVNVSDIKDTKNYTRSEIENLFGIKILKNSLIDNDMFQLQTFIENNQKIANIAFDFIDSPLGFDMFFGIRTKYWQDKENDDITWIAGGTKDIEYYYIPSLDTEAAIIDTTTERGIMLVDFVYKDVGYAIHVDKHFCNKDDLYNLLNSFYLDE